MSKCHYDTINQTTEPELPWTHAPNQQWQISCTTKPRKKHILLLAAVEIQTDWRQPNIVLNGLVGNIGNRLWPSKTKGFGANFLKKPMLRTRGHSNLALQKGQISQQLVPKSQSPSEGHHVGCTSPDFPLTTAMFGSPFLANPCQSHIGDTLEDSTENMDPILPWTSEWTHIDGWIMLDYYPQPDQHYIYITTVVG